MRGLSLLQAPPFIIVSGFFISASLFWFFGSLLELCSYLKDLWSLPLYVHISTIGFALFVMFGALFQMLPVVAGAVIKEPKKKALISWLLLLLGFSLFTTGFYLKNYSLIMAGSSLLLTGVLFTAFLFLYHLLKLKSFTPTSRGFKFALAFVLSGAVAGFLIVLSYGNYLPYSPWLLHLHMVLMLFGWVFLLIASVSFQVVEMFFVARPYPRLYAMNFPYFFTPALLLALYDSIYTRVPLLALVLSHVLLTLHRLYTSRRGFADKSIYFWYLAFLNLLVSIPFFLFKESFLYQFLLSFGLFFTILITGMSLRIISFLVWFHLSNEGAKQVPLMSEVIGEKLIKACFFLSLLLTMSLHALSFHRMYLLPVVIHIILSGTLSLSIIKGSLLYFRLSPLYNAS